MARHLRHPRTQSERKADARSKQDDLHAPISVKARYRGIKKSELPTERDDKAPAGSSDRSRGKPTHSAKRKASERHKGRMFDGNSPRR